MRKCTHIFIVFMIVAAFSSFSCFAKGPAGTKQYVSKYGFAVSYPAKWVAEEIWRTTNIPPDKKGLLPVNIYDPNDETIDLTFSNRGGDALESPRSITEKLRYLAQNEIMSKIDREEILEDDKQKYCLVQGVLKGKGTYQEKARSYIFFYLPKTNTIELVDFGPVDAGKARRIMQAINIKIIK